ncbi:MAG: hypothetical protein ACE5G5_11640 [Candidatus Methylomirabilales bacterium]
MEKRKHERKVCEAVIHVMGNRKRETLSVVGVPDEKERQEKAVDFRLRGTSSEFILEHTRIESFPGQITDDRQFVNLLGPLEAELSGTLPTPGHYVLDVAPGAVRGATRGQRVREALVAWVCKKAPALELGSPRTAPNHCIREVPTGVPFEVTLCRWPSLDGRFYIARSVRNDLEMKRRLRIGTALDDKCPKLRAAKFDGVTSVLVFESNDIALANCADIGEAFVKELSRRQDAIPDEVYLVETELERWAVWVLKEGSRLFPNVSEAGPHYVDSRA